MAQRVPALREIEAADWKAQRFGWLESVRRDADLSATARLVAHVLALDFANRETARCDPPLWEVAAVIGCSEDTAKRAVSALVEGGWIAREAGRGRGRTSGYTFLTRAVVVPLKGGKNAPRKGGTDAPLSASQKGANLPGKGGKNAPAYNIAKPCKNHGARAVAGLSENPMVHHTALRAVEAFRAGRADAFADLPDFVIRHVVAANLLTADERQRAGLGQ